MKRIGFLLVATQAAFLAELPRAHAQTGEEIEKGTPIADPNVPDNPVPRPVEETKTTLKRYSKAEYPIELIRRPLTLAKGQGQVSLEVPFVAGDGQPTLTEVLRIGFGVTRDLELGLTYDFGLAELQAPAGTSAYEAGKAFSIDAGYTLLPGYLAAQVRVPLYLDPDNFGAALTLGAPFRITIIDQLAVFGGQDLVRFKLARLAVDAADPAFNLAELALRERGGVTAAGVLNVTVGALYQFAPATAFFGTFGMAWPDFSSQNQATSLFVGGSYSPRRMIDLGGRIGFASLAHPAASFTLALYAALRL